MDFNSETITNSSNPPLMFSSFAINVHPAAHWATRAALENTNSREVKTNQHREEFSRTQHPQIVVTHVLLTNLLLLTGKNTLEPRKAPANVILSSSC